MSKPSIIERDEQIVNAILSKPIDQITATERYTLVNIVKVSYHDSGKIQGMFSIDSSCHGCEFCQHMRKCAESNPLHICGMCYDHAQEEYRENVRKRHALTMRILSSVEFTVEELSILPINGMCRFNSSGDLRNDTHARNYIRIAIGHPLVKFALWAKNVKSATVAFRELGKPENMVFIQSSPIIGLPCKRSEFADYTFTVYPDEATTEAAIASGSCACNGRKCAECGYKCYVGGWKNGANIAEFLRVSKVKRVEIMGAYIARFGA